MAITELIFPTIKPIKEVVDEVEENWPTMSKALIHPNPGLLSAFRGWVVSENDKDVRDQYREVLIFEWVEEASFYSFIASAQFASFVGMIKRFIQGPPILQLYNTDLSPKNVAVAPVVEIIRLIISDSEKVKEAQESWKVFSGEGATNGQVAPTVVSGHSLNLEGNVVVGMLGWASTEARETGLKDKAFETALESLSLLGDLSRIIVEVDPMELSAL
ncbi:hypothetical protein N7478_010373 [Penicillium angulare]|uniref:uncharacterized protein n=1 Tax=Penicillium angulare TaxID=116970 RepID=UPI00253FF704|nr:uncharacterized protein N7478_010373 [Penicillium angulare]KAJ5267565.1 hypothetical protein N7478_010373 [Penicillium angulare]